MEWWHHILLAVAVWLMGYAAGRSHGVAATLLAINKNIARTQGHAAPGVSLSALRAAALRGKGEK